MIRGQTGLVLGRVGAMNLALEKGKRVTTGGKGAEVRLEVKLERSLGWLQMHLPRMAWEKDMERLVDGGWQLEKWRYCWYLCNFNTVWPNFLRHVCFQLISQAVLLQSSQGQLFKHCMGSESTKKPEEFANH